MKYNDIDKMLFEFNTKLFDAGVLLPLSKDLSVLAEPLKLGKLTVPNRIGIQPMEGCDGTADGKPDELTLRRYTRFASGGAGLIWFEATAVVPEGRANPRQLYMCRNNLDSFKRTVEQIKNTAICNNGSEPVIICQLTHSGRYSKPNGYPEPIIAYNNPLFEKDAPIDSACIASDSYLASLPEHFAEASRLAELAGFDGVDIKCCHRYLMCELMSAFTRKGEYGGSLENRTRLYFDTIREVKQNVSDSYLVTSRFNIYDGFAYPYSFGTADDESLTPDLSEPINVCKTLKREFGFSLINITMGNPYVNPHVNRPADSGTYALPENPLKGVERMFNLTKQLKSKLGKMALMSSAHTYPREMSAFLAAGAVKEGISSIAGFGRMAFAYPDFARDILINGELDPRKCCVACGKCSQLMRAGTVAGCVVRDSAEYLPRYKEFCL